MYIKQVIIRGFKTYKDQVQLEQTFDPAVNVVVGYNGSGKSNFFNAILFVISDRFGTLRNETRKSLLHEGAGSAVLTAFVEIVFDNSDKRMPVDRDEVRICRTIAAKKDDYTLDGKVTTRAEVFKLLESCGFAKSNPYYIVQQGKVAELTVMNDANRLDLFMQLSGVSTYDERRTECLRILEDLRVKREKTDGVMQLVRRKIVGLEDEQRELRQYQKLEQQRRCLEFVMTDRDWSATQERLEKLEVQKGDASSKLHQVQRDLTVAQERAIEAETKFFEVFAGKAQVEVKRQECERMRGLRVQALTAARLELDDENSRAQAADKSMAERRAEKQKIEAEIYAIHGELAEHKPELERKQAQIHETTQRKHVAQAERDALLAKQGRGLHYSSVAQRNRFLDEEISRRQPKRDQQQKTLKECQKKTQDLRSRQDDYKSAIGDRRIAMHNLEATLGPEHTNQLDKINGELVQASEHRRGLLQQMEHLSREKEQVRGKVQQLQNRIEGTMPRLVRSALTDSLAKVEEKGWGGKVLGTLMDSIKIDPRYAVAVESAAGHALFNLLVVDDHVATEIIKYVRQFQLGSIVCTPLNQIKPRPREYPKIKGCKPLIDFIEAKDEVRPAVLQVFGRTMVCSSIELCDVISNKHGFDAVTMEGDRVSSQGTMTGGDQDPSGYVRLKLCAERRMMQGKLVAVDEQLTEIEHQVEEWSQRIEQLHQRKRNTYAQRQTKRAELTQAAEALHEGERELQRLGEAIHWQKECEHEAAICLVEYNAGIEALTRERQSKTIGQLSSDEHALVENLTTELRELNTSLDGSKEARNKLQRELHAREQHLNGYLRRHAHEIEQEMLRSSQQDHHERAQERDRTVTRLTAEVAEIEQQMERLSAEVRAEEEAMVEKKQRLDDTQKEANSYEATVTAQLASIDDIAMKINNLTKKKEEYDEKLRRLTIVSNDLAVYKSMATNEIIEELRNVNKELAKFEHVNKKVIDQFATFQDQLKDLDDEALEMAKSKDAIQHLIQEVDAQKEDLLLDVLSKVDKHFQDIFNELVRDGSARLTRVTSMEEDIDTINAGKRKQLVAPDLASGIKGVKIEVSFTGQTTSFLTMNQLSGGQKTVVALALIFAIQRMEPAPFYLFDEIDAALDNQYRTAVAKLIQKDARGGAQMIITTFRPEIIDVADSCYRVTMRNRCSAIESVERARAKEVVDQQVATEGLGE